MHQCRVSSKRKRYLLRDIKSQESIAVVEATTPEQAITRGKVIEQILLLTNRPVNFSSEEINVPTVLPNFYSDLFSFTENEMR